MKNDVSQALGRFDPTLLEMSNLGSKRTGVRGAIIFVSAGEFGGKDSQHGPRVKVVLGNKVQTDNLEATPSVTIERHPEVRNGSLPGHIEKEVKEFVFLNQEALLAYWRKEITTDVLFDRLMGIHEQKERT